MSIPHGKTILLIFSLQIRVLLKTVEYLVHLILSWLKPILLRLKAQWIT